MGKSKDWRKIPPHKTPEWVKRYIPRCKAGVTEEEGINTLYVKGRHYVYKIVAVLNADGSIKINVYRRKRSRRTKIYKPIKKKPSYERKVEIKKVITILAILAIIVIFVFQSRGIRLFLQSVCEDISNWWSETDNYSTLMIPRNYYSKADEMVPDPQIHSIKTLYDTLMPVKLPRYDINSFRCSHASAYLEWYLEGAGFDTYIVESEELDHAWVIVELPEEGRVAIEATALCEDTYQPPGIIISPEGKFEKYSMYYQSYLDYLNKYSAGDYILPSSFEDYLSNYLSPPRNKYTYFLGFLGEIKVTSSDYYYGFDNKFSDIYEAYSFYNTIEGINWWDVEPFCSRLNW